ncbi:MAG: hypothetical protein MJ252_11940 [archaeon]|nr:hypothetical protein [archaeon]
MLKYEYLKAPVFCIDGVPSYKAGEWPGIKCSRFENTRQMIRQIPSETVFMGGNKIFYY